MLMIENLKKREKLVPQLVPSFTHNQYDCVVLNGEKFSGKILQENQIYQCVSSLIESDISLVGVNHSRIMNA